MTIGGFFAQYGLFVAQFITVLVLLALLAALVVVAARKGSHPGEGLRVQKINKQLKDIERSVQRAILSKDSFKKERKENKRQEKLRAKSADEDMAARGRVYVIDFKGDLRASATSSLRREITAVLSVASQKDRVLLRLENAGGVVHEHGLAASQLLRFKARGIHLTVSVDKVAASGGYLMACVADRIIAAPFAIIGSIGVVAQLPNFHRLLESKGIDFEQITAGRFKRTLTMFGENTDEGRDKLRSELEEIHGLFQSEVRAHRPEVELDAVSTGEHWYGMRAIDLKLIDEIRTSDDYLLEAVEKSDVYRVSYRRHKSIPERVIGGIEGLLAR